MFGNQGLTIRHGNLVVVRVDFGKSQEALPVAAVLDEGGLQRRLHARHLRKIDVPFQGPLAGGLEIEFIDALAIDYNHPRLLRVAESISIRLGIGFSVRPLPAADRPARGRASAGAGGSRNGVGKPEHCPMRCVRFGGAIGSGSVCHLVLNF